MTELADTEIDTETAKRIGELELEQTISSRAVLLEEHSAAFRWLMASMLALNGAGLLALKDTTSLANCWGIGAAVCFYIGVAAALLIAVFGQRSVQASLAPLSELIAFWTLVAISGELKEEVHSDIIGRVQRSAAIGKRARYAGYASFLAFSLGLVGAMIAK